jgi:hypothetical protein
MRIDLKSGSDINITDPKNAELFFDINDNALAIKTIDGQFNVKQNISEFVKNSKNLFLKDDLTTIYSSSMCFSFDYYRYYGNDTAEVITLSNANRL